ncbi:MAG: phosphatidylserine decarboxylase [Armatimonadota bacterium]
MRLARGGEQLVFGAYAVTLLALAGSLWVNPWLWLLAAPLGVSCGILTAFFRDPERPPAPGLVAPADGVIQAIHEKDGVRQIITFMNLLDVHVNRAPLDARVLRMEQIRGGYVPAYRDDAHDNQRLEWDLETEIGPIRMVQITGAVARRIVPYHGPGTTLRKGERIGMIRLGSRVDLYIPSQYPVAVSVGQRVRAGVTTLARLDT